MVIPRRRRGANALEFALTAPVFLALVAALFDYSWFFTNRAILDISVAEGCRAGALIDAHMSDPRRTAVEEMGMWANLATLECGSSANCLARTEGEVPTRYLVCTIDASYEPLIGLVPVPDEIHTAAIARLEWQRPR